MRVVAPNIIPSTDGNFEIFIADDGNVIVGMFYERSMLRLTKQEFSELYKVMGELLISELTDSEADNDDDDVPF